MPIQPLRVTYVLAALDPKRRVTTRPSSTLSFAAPYTPSPVPEQPTVAQATLSHAEAMERFLVSRLGAL